MPMGARKGTMHSDRGKLESREPMLDGGSNQEEEPFEDDGPKAEPQKGKEGGLHSGRGGIGHDASGRRGSRGKNSEAADEIAEEREDTGVSSMEGGMGLETIVGLPTWREALLELVDTHKLDPWNIDIVEVASGYLQKIRNMEMLDLRIPANLILAAAILIRFKSDALRFEEQAPLPEEAIAPDEDYGVAGIPPLELNGRIPPKRMVTLDELITAMDRVFDEQKKREEKAQRIEIPSVMNIQLPEFNIEQRMAEVYGRVLAEKDSEGLATFSSLLREGTSEEIIYTLLPMLHLVQDRKLTVFQEKFFGEIFIRVQEESGKVKGEAGKAMMDGMEAEEEIEAEGMAQKSKAR